MTPFDRTDGHASRFTSQRHPKPAASASTESVRQDAQYGADGTYSLPGNRHYNPSASLPLDYDFSNQFGYTGYGGNAGATYNTPSTANPPFNNNANNNYIPVTRGTQSVDHSAHHSAGSGYFSPNYNGYNPNNDQDANVSRQYDTTGYGGNPTSNYNATYTYRPDNTYFPPDNNGYYPNGNQSNFTGYGSNTSGSYTSAFATNPTSSRYHHNGYDDYNPYPTSNLSSSDRYAYGNGNPNYTPTPYINGDPAWNPRGPPSIYPAQVNNNVVINNYGASQGGQNGNNVYQGPIATNQVSANALSLGHPQRGPRNAAPVANQGGPGPSPTSGQTERSRCQGSTKDGVHRPCVKTPAEPIWKNSARTKQCRYCLANKMSDVAWKVVQDLEAAGLEPCSSCYIRPARQGGGFCQVCYDAKKENAQLRKAGNGKGRKGGKK
ncbi:hypothetical protein B0T20DRAFT_392410 [Sordaria brevicollis]|uniref:Uncharacterized protein n=1 Tax=Sordaria brevicollis TaxID=83679 RepID=A0AAE0UDG5_SORBR|nr:hypothetical protein B0T20DRAFT_392410 [Sordaria brevicollis]